MSSPERKTEKPALLLVNPWIFDVAAYDFFARPLGLLYLAGLLRQQGFQVHLLDCLAVPHARQGPFGTGRYPKEILPPPPALAAFPRRYGRYGLSEAEFRARLARFPEPQAILVTSLMTYWYPGVQAAIARLREFFPRTPVILGGIYATLCPEHARRHSGADVVVTGPGEEKILPVLGDLLGLPGGKGPLDLLHSVSPALDLAGHLNFIPLLTSRGCPFACSYCASALLSPPFRRRSPAEVVEELLSWRARLGLMEVVFYDDALLVNAEDHLLVILEELARKGESFRFHTPNGLHARFLTPEVARWLKRSGFATLRLGVETAAASRGNLDHKLKEEEVEAAIRHLKEAGFTAREIGVYLLLGLPHQEDAEVEYSIRRIRQWGATPILALYSPIPGTGLWPEAVAVSPYDLEHEPLYHNNSLFPCWPVFSWSRYTRLKRLAQGIEA